MGVAWCAVGLVWCGLATWLVPHAATPVMAPGCSTPGL